MAPQGLDQAQGVRGPGANVADQRTPFSRGQITSGELAPGQQLPSALALAGTYQVSAPTVKKALGVLKNEGLIVGVAGYGTFVAER
jgi:GntR family transcriptional regulator